ncbi:pirin family protein [Coraliomargarita parva]|uniref:pirin family protein n=1 Tax=Coraliomargarita parva TaxID=3014050 RepID=UPI0022B38882|nr:pirin family protein [Coraliomargarita parva]
MITRSVQRMRTQLDWLDSRHSFSFAGHYDPDRMGFGPLRVVNDDRVGPRGGFPPHPHKDMEIISLVLEGRLEHKDSLGNGRVIGAGEIQYMSAGSGVVHSEFNPSETEAVHFLQIWIEPWEQGVVPRYAEQAILGTSSNVWKLLLSPDGREGSMAIRQDAELRSLRLESGASIEYHSTRTGRGLWLFVLSGDVQVADMTLHSGDSLAVQDTGGLALDARGALPVEVLLFDLPL